MADKYELAYVDQPEQTAWGIIGHGLQDFNVQQVGPSGFERLCYVVRSPDGEIHGGLFGATYWQWLYIDLLWVKAELRGRGYGQRLLELSEQEARRRGAIGAYLDTFSFQAPEFYTRNGYRVFGELEDFPPGHRRFFMTKQFKGRLTE